VIAVRRPAAYDYKAMWWYKLIGPLTYSQCSFRTFAGCWSYRVNNRRRRRCTTAFVRLNFIRSFTWSNGTV